MFLPPSRPRRPVRGMSLIEVLISIAIMAGIILAMLGLVPYGF
jgi:prepilin-type N-terminal cleavage/methylation domain-containing protein